MFISGSYLLNIHIYFQKKNANISINLAWRQAGHIFITCHIKSPTRDDKRLNYFHLETFFLVQLFRVACVSFRTHPSSEQRGNLISRALRANPCGPSKCVWEIWRVADNEEVLLILLLVYFCLSLLN